MAPSSDQRHSPCSPPETPPAHSRPRRRKIAQREPGSLYDIMREHAGTSLYVLPICWTDLHTKLLGVRFVQLNPVLAPVPGPKLCNWDSGRPSQVATALGRELTTLLAAEKYTRWYHKSRAIKNVLSTLFPTTLSRPRSNAELDLYFGGRVFRKTIRLPVLWKHPDCAGASFDSAATRPATSFGRIPANSWNSANTLTSSQPSQPSQASQPSANQPMLAYINRRQLKQVRQHLFRVCSGPSGGDVLNTPVLSLQQLRSKQLIPADADRDAHYVAILLAMAQAHFYNESPSSKPSSQSSCARSSPGGTSIDMVPPNFRDVKVQLITHDEEANFIVYTAVVTATFLERFARPAKAPARPGPGASSSSDGSSEAASLDTGMEISFASVPIWPILGLKERLGKALGRDIASESIFQDNGDLISDSLETWDSPEERKDRQRMARKRRRAAERETLAEMVNSSGCFESEADEDQRNSESLDLPVLSPDAKRRYTRSVGPLEVC
jgi:hypothetical protein